MSETGIPPSRHDELVRAVAAYGLAGSVLDFPTAPLDDDRFDALVSDITTQRMTGLLWNAIADGSLPATTAQADQAEWLHVESLAGSLVLEQLLLHTVDLLDRSDVPYRVLKGTAHGHLDYPDVGMRTFGDIDLLVPGTHFDTAVEIFAGQGHLRLHPQPRPGFDRRFSKGTSFRTADGLEIDLHRTLTMGPLGIRLDLDTLWERSDTFWIADRPLRALGREERFLHACYHAVLGNERPRLTPLRDLVQIALNGDLDTARLHAVIRASRGEAAVARAVRHGWREFAIADMLAISAWADNHRADAKQNAELAVYGPRSNYANKSFAAIRALPTFHDRASFVYALSFPTGEYLDQRHRSRVRRLTKGLAQATRAKRRSP